jgi:hypothetical protein
MYEVLVPARNIFNKNRVSAVWYRQNGIYYFKESIYTTDVDRKRKCTGSACAFNKVL